MKLVYILRSKDICNVYNTYWMKMCKFVSKVYEITYPYSNVHTRYLNIRPNVRYTTMNKEEEKTNLV